MEDVPGKPVPSEPKEKPKKTFIEGIEDWFNGLGGKNFDHLVVQK